MKYKEPSNLKPSIINQMFGLRKQRPVRTQNAQYKSVNVTIGNQQHNCIDEAIYNLRFTTANFKIASSTE